MLRKFIEALRRDIARRQREKLEQQIVKVREERRKKEAKRLARIAPFRPQIEAIAAQLNDTPEWSRLEGWISHRQRMIDFLEYYVVKHGRMPTGVIRRPEYVLGETFHLDLPSHDFGDPTKPNS